MALAQAHPLSKFDDASGYTIKEPSAKLVQTGETGTVSIDIRALSDLGPDLSRAPRPNERRPLRDVIPQTQGRLLGWKLADNVRKAKARNWPGIKPFEYIDQVAVICGGGPSLRDTLPELRSLQAKGAKVFAINRTHDWLLNLHKSHDVAPIKPWAGVLLEALPTAADYITPRHDVNYFIASQCDPVIFDKFEDYPHRLWHAQARKEMVDELTEEEKALMVPAISSTCGIRSIMLAFIMGFREIHVMGLDSCYRMSDIENGVRGADGAPRLHAYAKPEAIHNIKVLEIPDTPLGNLKYFGNANMIAQVDEFQTYMMWRADMISKKYMEPHEVIVHGSGAIPDLARCFGHHADQKG